MNILLIGTQYDDILSLIVSSKKEFKIYIAGENPSNRFPNIEYRSIPDLVAKAKVLQTDIAVNLDKTLILDGICEEFKKNRLNLISVNKKWLNLETSRVAAKKLLKHYSVNTADVIKLPLSFPVMLKSDFPEFDIKIEDKDDLIRELEKYEKENTYIEEYLEGEDYDLLVLWDGKNSYVLNPPVGMTEVQKDRFDLLKTKLNFMFSDEKADFTGFFTAHLIWAKNDWYVKEFSMDTGNLSFTPKYDFLYILDCAIYQKLNELE